MGQGEPGLCVAEGHCRGGELGALGLRGGVGDLHVWHWGCHGEVFRISVPSRERAGCWGGHRAV